MRNMMLVFTVALLGAMHPVLAQAPVPMGCFKDQGDPQGTSGRDLAGHMFFAAAAPAQRISPRTRTGAEIERPAPNVLQLPRRPAPVMSAGACTTECRARGFAFAGTQHGSYCFCGNRFGQSGPSTSCNMPCTGNPGETCGGAWANSVYWTGLNTPPAHGWTGSASCQVNVRGTNYSDSRTHTWTFLGNPTPQGTTQLHNAVWSVTGAGSVSTTTGSAQWTVNGGATGQMTVLVRPNGNRAIFSSHTQLRTQQNGIFGTQQQTGQNPGPIGAQAFEFAFPQVEGLATNTMLAGLSTPAVTGSVAFMQPAGAQATANCKWSFNLIP